MHRYVFVPILGCLAYALVPSCAAPVIHDTGTNIGLSSQNTRPHHSRTMTQIPFTNEFSNEQRFLITKHPPNQLDLKKYPIVMHKPDQAIRLIDSPQSSAPLHPMPAMYDLNSKPLPMTPIEDSNRRQKLNRAKSAPARHNLKLNQMQSSDKALPELPEEEKTLLKRLRTMPNLLKQKTMQFRHSKNEENMTYEMIRTKSTDQQRRATQEWDRLMQSTMNINKLPRKAVGQVDSKYRASFSWHKPDSP
ncbi:hypothetical protein BDF19DRAFT_414194 [Syncephalis fuscata]|nr:hypothetical protein BDF19DRAFT_414194 [Syncephalis fuscata]